MQRAADAVQRTVQRKLEDSVSAFDFMTKAEVDDVSAGAGALDVSASVRKAFACGRPIHMPRGKYNLASWTAFETTQPLTVSCDGMDVVDIVGPGMSQAFIEARHSVSLSGGRTSGFLADINYGNLAGGSATLDLFGWQSRDCRRSVVRDRTHSAGKLTRVSISHCVIDHAGISALLDTRGILLQGEIENAYIHHNIITNVRGQAISLGDNTRADQDLMQRFIVDHNLIGNLHRPGGGEVQGIIIYGRYATVDSNVIYEVSNDDSQGAEGIYFKCRYGNIRGNVLVNAGRREASINIKGGTRSDGALGPDGYAVICTGNHILGTLPGVYGISPRTDDCLIADNYIEGVAGEYGIYTVNSVTNGLHILRNTLKNVQGRIGIYVRCGGYGIRVDDNTVDGVLVAGGVATAGIGILLSADVDLDRVSLCRNHIFLRSSEATQRNQGIAIAGNADLKNLTVDGNVIVIDGVSSPEGIVISHSSAAVRTGWKFLRNDLSGVNASSDNMLFRVTSSIPADAVFVGNFDKTPLVRDVAVGAAISPFLSGYSIANTAAAATTLVPLPVAQPGLVFDFFRTGGFALRADPAAADSIRGGGIGKYASLDTDGAHIQLKCIKAGMWEVVGQFGTVTFEP